MDTESTTRPIIRAKLNAPSVRLGHVRRDRLLELLDQALAVLLTLVSAPIGWYSRSQPERRVRRDDSAGIRAGCD